MTSEALLVRHCESIGSAPDSALTERGRAQAAELAALLATEPIATVISSPYRRARASAEPLCERTGLHLDLDARLQEWELPWVPPEHWPGALAPIVRGEVALPPEIEPLATVRARGLAAVHEALARDGRSVLVTHGKLLALVLAELAGRDPFEVFRDLRNAHVFDVRRASGGFAVRSRWYPT